MNCLGGFIQRFSKSLWPKEFAVGMFTRRILGQTSHSGRKLFQKLPSEEKHSPHTQSFSGFTTI